MKKKKTTTTKHTKAGGEDDGTEEIRQTQRSIGPLCQFDTLLKAIDKIGQAGERSKERNVEWRRQNDSDEVWWTFDSPLTTQQAASQLSQARLSFHIKNLSLHIEYWIVVYEETLNLNCRSHLPCYTVAKGKLSEWVRERNIIFNRSQNTIYNRFELHAATCESSLAGGLMLSRLVELAHSMWALKETSVESREKKSNIFTFAANERHPVGEAHTTWLLQAVKWSK